MTSADVVVGDVQGEAQLLPAHDSAVAQPHLDRTVGALLFVGVLGVYVAVTRGTYYAYDSQAMVAVTMNIVNHGSLKTTGFVDAFHLATPYSPYGIAVSILAVPPYALSKVFGHANLLISLVNPTLMACAVLMVYRTARALTWSAVHGLTAAVGFGLFTMALQSTTELFSEPGVTLCLMLMVYGVVKWGAADPRAPIWIGLGAAAAIQFRTDSVFTIWIGLLALPLFVPWQKIIRTRPLIAIGAPIVISVLFLVWYNELRYGKILVSSYGESFSTPLSFGLHGLLLDPGKSIFVFNALALLGVVGLGALLVRDRPVAVLFLLLIVPRLLFFAKWASWDGGWSWGPRFMLPTVPLLILAAVELLRVWDRRSLLGILTRGIAAVLVCFSVVVNYLSIRVPYQQWLQTLATPATLAKLAIRPQTGAQQIADYDTHLSTGPLWGDVTLIRHHLAVMGPDWWAHGRWFVGWLLLLAAVAALGWGGVLARRLDRAASPAVPSRGPSSAGVSVLQS